MARFARNSVLDNKYDRYTLNAHFDGQSIVLDEPFELPGNAPLLVTVVSAPMDGDRAQWSDLAASGLATAYGDDEPEYSSQRA